MNCRPSQLMKIITGIYPRFWTTSYQRGKLFRGQGSAAPDTVTIHLTDACPLNCPFCLASQADRGHALTREELQQVFDLFHGVSRFILLGGEPLAYSGMWDMLEQNADAADCFEIFTNGVPLLRNQDAALPENFINQHGTRTILTFPVDDYHRQQIGHKDFHKLLTLALDMHKEQRIGIRFNVTDPRFYSLGYLNYSGIRDLLQDYHPGLRDQYDAMFTENRLMDVFYFNPVIRHAAIPGQGEPLNALALTYYPELVVGRRRGHRRVAVMTSLASLWMNPVPDSLVATYIDDINAVEKIAAGLLGHRIPQDLFSLIDALTDTGETPGRDPSLLGQGSVTPIKRLLQEAVSNQRSDSILRTLKISGAWEFFSDWENRAHEYHKLAGDKLAALAESSTGFPLDLSSPEPGYPVTWSSLRYFLNRYLSEDKRLAQTLEATLRPLEAAYQDNRRPMQDGTRFYMGRFIHDDTERLSIASATLLLHGKAVDHQERLTPLVPRLLLSQEGLEIGFFFLEFARNPNHPDPDDSWHALFKIYRAILEDREWELLLERARQGVLSPAIRSLDTGLAAPQFIDQTLPPADAVRVFEMLAYDARADELPWGLPELSVLLKGHNGRGFSTQSWECLLQENDYWQKHRGGGK